MTVKKRVSRGPVPTWTKPKNYTEAYQLVDKGIELDSKYSKQYLVRPAILVAYEFLWQRASKALVRGYRLAVMKKPDNAVFSIGINSIGRLYGGEQPMNWINISLDNYQNEDPYIALLQLRQSLTHLENLEKEILAAEKQQGIAK